MDACRGRSDGVLACVREHLTGSSILARAPIRPGGEDLSGVAESGAGDDLPLKPEPDDPSPRSRTLPSPQLGPAQPGPPSATRDEETAAAASPTESAAPGSDEAGGDQPTAISHVGPGVGEPAPGAAGAPAPDTLDVKAIYRGWRDAELAIADVRAATDPAEPDLLAEPLPAGLPAEPGPPGPAVIDRARREVADALAAVVESDGADTPQSRPVGEAGEDSRPEPVAEPAPLEAADAAALTERLEHPAVTQEERARTESPLETTTSDRTRALPPPGLVLLVAPDVRPAAPVTEDPGATASIEPASEPVLSDAPAVLAMPLRNVDVALLSPGRVVVRPGDTLWKIARRVYGEGHRYETIYRANRDRLTSPHRLRPGQVLDVPLVFD